MTIFHLRFVTTILITEQKLTSNIPRNENGGKIDSGFSREFLFCKHLLYFLLSRVQFNSMLALDMMMHMDDQSCRRSKVFCIAAKLFLESWGQYISSQLTPTVPSSA